MATEQESAAQRVDVRFEGSDIHGGTVVAIGVGLLMLAVVTAGALFFLYSYLRHQAIVESPAPLPVTTQGIVPPEPRLQVSPPQDMSELRAAWEFELQHYGWIDQGRGVVRIPIDKAIDAVAQQGIPTQKTDPALFFQPRMGDPSTGLEGISEVGPQ